MKGDKVKIVKPVKIIQGLHVYNIKAGTRGTIVSDGVLVMVRIDDDYLKNHQFLFFRSDLGL